MVEKPRSQRWALLLAFSFAFLIHFSGLAYLINVSWETKTPSLFQAVVGPLASASKQLEQGAFIADKQHQLKEVFVPTKKVVKQEVSVPLVSQEQTPMSLAEGYPPLVELVVGPVKADRSELKQMTLKSLEAEVGLPRLTEMKEAKQLAPVPKSLLLPDPPVITVTPRVDVTSHIQYFASKVAEEELNLIKDEDFARGYGLSPDEKILFGDEETKESFSKQVLQEQVDEDLLFAKACAKGMSEEDLERRPSFSEENQGLQASLLDSPTLENFYSSGKDLKRAQSSDFVIKTKLYRRSKGGGYFFEIDLSPKKDVPFERMKQNLFFIIDRSNSVSKSRYQEAKQSVLQALDYLRPEDTFNILVFDDHVVRFSKDNLEANRQNIQKAQSFLEEQHHGGLFASTDLYDILDDLIPEAVHNNEVNTALLFSDGDSFLSKEGKRRSIHTWTRQNRGRISLYAVASGRKQNLALLELLCFMNRGALLKVGRSEKLAEQVNRLMHVLPRPIGKEMRSYVVSKHQDQKILLYPQADKQPDLYASVPYRIFGYTSSPEDFYLFLQGRHYVSGIDLKCHVAFEKALPPNLEVERRWVLFRAFDHYQNFLQDGGEQHLEAANQLLHSIHYPIAFE